MSDSTKTSKPQDEQPARAPRKLKIEKKPLDQISDHDLDGVVGGLRDLSDSTCNSKRGGCCDRVRL